jgi:hypothetical protein
MCRNDQELCGSVFKELLILIVLLDFIVNAEAQVEVDVFPEAPYKIENNVLLSNRITVNFKDKVFDLEQGRIAATITDIDNRFANLKSAFQTLQQKYGSISFEKQIPTAVWGDVWRTNKVNGELVRNS